MDKTAKLARYYKISKADAQLLVSAGLDTPRKIKADKSKVDAVLAGEKRAKVKAR